MDGWKDLFIEQWLNFESYNMCQKVCINSKLVESVYCFHLFSSLISWRSKTKMLPHLRIKTHLSIIAVTKVFIATCFARPLILCKWGKCKEWWVPMGRMLTVVATFHSLCSYGWKKQHCWAGDLFETVTCPWQHWDTDSTVTFLLTAQPRALKSIFTFAG